MTSFSARSCAALVGDSSIPSFPSSVHIPSLNSHQSLLSSRDEVFKEIQDVGEDNSLSSLHLFFGNMDLPPSSYHDSLEELWDEKEEPEEVKSVMKIFNTSVAFPISTTVLSIIIQRRSVHAPVSSRTIPASPSMRKLLVSFTNSNRLSPPLQSFSTHHLFKKQEYSSQEIWIPQTFSNSKWSLDLSFNELHHSTATVQFFLFNSGRSGQVFIPSMSSITSLDLVHLFIKNMFANHGLLSSIVSDRGSLFVSSFWTNLYQQLKISRDLSISYHPETDGQTERVNQILEQYLCMYVSYHQDDWDTWLPLAEFAYNNSDNSSTRQSTFFTVYGRDPQFDSVHITQDTPSGKLSTKVQSVQQDVQRELEVAINRFKRYADKSRASAPVFNPGDMVWLSSKNIKSTRPTKTLSEKWLGPFPILKKVSTHAYHVKLPSQWKSIHPVFHISRLEPVKK
ncbi:hypothetical protein O181_069640 [Austropuccinia psidii MF-1]|uniref:Integrase catalytic domain-containing protein n=1 Tax=Austropuccinia psidii MF-1 TaxID=1389203 RepID=A0A9Q3F3B7_9BASI|nr:hypothetical protein [Austropuccinia psidii MF-1]